MDTFPTCRGKEGEHGAAQITLVPMCTPILSDGGSFCPPGNYLFHCESLRKQRASLVFCSDWRSPSNGWFDLSDLVLPANAAHKAAEIARRLSHWNHPVRPAPSVDQLEHYIPDELAWTALSLGGAVLLLLPGTDLHRPKRSLLAGTLFGSPTPCGLS